MKDKHKWYEDKCLRCGCLRSKEGPHSYVYLWPYGDLKGKPPPCGPEYRRIREETLRGQLEAVLIPQLVKKAGDDDNYYVG